MPVPQIVIDDFTLSPSLDWIDSRRLNGSYFNGTVSVWHPDEGSGFFEWRFNGTQTAIYARHPADFAYRYYLLENDDGDENTANLTEKTEAQDKANKAILTHYSLDENIEHVARFAPVRGLLSLDYVLYKPLDRAPVAGLTVLVDDQDYDSEDARNLVKYDSGVWEKRGLVGAVFPPGRPLGETISETTEAGASFSYTFNGSSIAVHGALHQAPGTLRVQYDIDGQTFNTTHFNGLQPEAEDDWRLNAVLFHRVLVEDEFPAPNPARPDEHTLTVRVEEVTGNQTYLFDYLTYTGTENTILSIPRTRSFEIDRTMNPGPIVAAAIAVILLWLWVFLGDKLPLVGSSSRAKRRRSVPHGSASEGYRHSQTGAKAPVGA